MSKEIVTINSCKLTLKTPNGARSTITSKNIKPLFEELYKSLVINLTPKELEDYIKELKTRYTNDWRGGIVDYYKVMEDKKH